MERAEIELVPSFLESTPDDSATIAAGKVLRSLLSSRDSRQVAQLAGILHE
jgi:hypothetical protein